MDIEEIANRSAAGIALAYRSGETGPVALVECLLARIEAAKDQNIFITVTAERARAEARQAEARYRDGTPLSPLDGVPIAWKDIIDVAGTPTTAASKLFSGEPAKTRDLACVANAAAAGMVTMGKLNLTELAYSGLGLNPHYGTPWNPADRAIHRSPGGSSSGSGAAVGARLVPIAIGSDTGGSVRIPAAFNGVVGFKTSTGRIDSEGLVALARSYDTIGPLTRTVEDCVLADMVMRGAVTTRVRRVDPASLAVLVPTNIVFDDADPDVVENFERTLSELSRVGVEIRRERVEVLDELMELSARHGTLTAAEAYHEYREIVDSERVGGIDRRVVKRIMAGKDMSANDLLSIQRGRARLIPQFLDQLGAALFAMPTTPITAPEVAPLEADDELFHRTNVLTLRNTMLGNILDVCGVAMPNGRDRHGLPTSFLVSAGRGEDDRILSAALSLETIVRDAGAETQLLGRTGT